MKNRSQRLRTVLGALAAILATRLVAATPPNVVIIVGDDMGYADIGVHGCQDIPTPHIDALAGAGVRCTNGYVSGVYCSPTRAGLLTGRYQQRFGHEFNPGGNGAGAAAARGLPLSERTLADRLQAAGYATGLVGKWHLGALPEFHPLERGFDEFFGFLGGAHSYFPGARAPILRGTEPFDEREYLTDAFAREAVDFIDRHSSEPFFLYLAFKAVHGPLEATPERLAKFAPIEDKRRRTYAAMMAAMDDAVGAVAAKLADAGLEDNTLVFFISDNGGPTRETTARNSSAELPLRGTKRTTLEGGVRVPFFVKWPARLPAGKVYDAPVIQLDVAPTALAAAEVELPDDAALEGVNLLEHLTGRAAGPPHDALYWRMGRQMAVRQGDWKLVRYDPAADGERGAPRAAKLYNLAADPGESHDLADDEPEKVAELQMLWDAWNSNNVRPLWRDDRPRGPNRGARRKRPAEADVSPAPAS